MPQVLGQQEQVWREFREKRANDTFDRTDFTLVKSGE
jgi:hypothetical protein